MLKKLLFLISMLFLYGCIIHAQSLTVSGGTNLRIPHGQSYATFTFYFSYSNTNGLSRPVLVVEVDEESYSTETICSVGQGGSWLPSSYQVNVSGAGTHEVTFALTSMDTQYMSCWDIIAWDLEEKDVTCKYEIEIKNDPSGGHVKVNTTSRSSGWEIGLLPTESVNIEAISPQTYSNYTHTWHTGSTNKSDWKKYPKSLSFTHITYNQSTTYTANTSDESSKLIAYLKRTCNLTFENELNGSSETGTMTIDGQTTFTKNVVEDNAVIAAAQHSYDYDGIDFHFDEWSPGGSTSETTTFYPTAHTDYTAEYIGTPSFSLAESDLSFNSYSPRPGADNRVKLTWTEHENTGVTKYEIWRKGKDNGVPFDDGKIAEVNRGTTTYTDGDYILTNGYTDDILNYAVRAYYSPDVTLSSLDYKTTYGDDNAQSKKAAKEEVAVNLIKEYKISNYPNPYNPATNIFYQLPENGHVTIKVYDMLGREIKELVNSVRTSGRYEVQFDGSDLSSGTYIYQIVVDALGEGSGYSASKKMLLIK